MPHKANEEWHNSLENADVVEKIVRNWTKQHSANFHKAKYETAVATKKKKHPMKEISTEKSLNVL